MTRVYLPLRSNIGWSQTQGLRDTLACRLKEVLLLYDEIIIEDGTFVAYITDSGGFYPYFPPGSLPEDQRLIDNGRDIQPAEFGLNIKPSNSNKPWNPLLSGKTSARYKSDYYDVTKDSHIDECDFVKRVVVQNQMLPEEVQQAIRSETNRDRSLFSKNFKSHLLGDLVISNLNRDIMVATSIGSAIIVDPEHNALLREKCKISNAAVPKGGEDHCALQHLVSIACPNFYKLSVDDVLELRNDMAWRDFRGYLSRLVEDIAADPYLLTDRRVFQDKVMEIFVQSLLKELSLRHPSGYSLVLDLGLGATSLIPGYGIAATFASAGKTVNEYLQSRGSWLAFLLKLQKGT